MERKFYIYNTQEANGVRVIVDNLYQALEKRGLIVEEIKHLNGLSKDTIVIPFGVKECYEVARLGFENKFGLLVDAISLGYKNKIKFYFKHLHVFNYDFFYSIYGYLRYSRMEKNVIDSYNHVMLVSKIDIDYLKQTKHGKNCCYHCVPNGMNSNSIIGRINKQHDRLRLGILSSWVTKQTFEETNWFLQTYYRKYAEEYGDVDLYIAGRGERIKSFCGMKNVYVVGEVNNLNDFFTSIDVFLALNPKGCGILNRVLDAISYNVAIAGVPASFSGFPDSDGSFVKFDSYLDFCNSITYLKKDTVRRELSQNAINYAMKYHNWDENYNKFVSEVINSFI